MLELYHSILSPCAQKVRLALYEKQLGYESHVLNIVAKENLSTEYLKLNPNGVVPTLVHNGRAVIESTLILEYLEDVFPEPALRPGDAADCASMRLWSKMVDEKLHPAAGAIVWSTAMRHEFLALGKEEALSKISRVPDRERRERQRRILESGWDAPDARNAVMTYAESFAKVNRLLESQPWLGGERLSIADLALAPYVQALHQMGLEQVFLAAHSGVNRWFDEIRARPSFQNEILAKLPQQRVAAQKKRGAEAVPEIERILNDSQTEILRAQASSG